MNSLTAEMEFILSFILPLSLHPRYLAESVLNLQPVLSSRAGPLMQVGGKPPLSDIRTHRILKLFPVDMTNSEVFLCFVFEMQIIMGSH